MQKEEQRKTQPAPQLAITHPIEPDQIVDHGKSKREVIEHLPLSAHAQKNNRHVDKRHIDQRENARIHFAANQQRRNKCAQNAEHADRLRTINHRQPKHRQCARKQSRPGGYGTDQVIKCVGRKNGKIEQRTSAAGQHPRKQGIFFILLPNKMTHPHKSATREQAQHHPCARSQPGLLNGIAHEEGNARNKNRNSCKGRRLTTHQKLDSDLGFLGFEVWKRWSRRSSNLWKRRRCCLCWLGLLLCNG